MHDQSSDESEDEEEGPESLVRKLDGQDEKTANGLTKRAAMFFDQDIFADISEDDVADEEDGQEGDEEEEFSGFSDDDGDVVMKDAAEDDGFETEEEDGFEVVKVDKDNWDADDEPMKNGRPGTAPLISVNTILIKLLLMNYRYRHHYCRSHDSGTATCQR